MAENRKCFTFIWKIKNFSCCNSWKYSPEFIAPTVSANKFYLRFYPNSADYKGCVACYIYLAQPPTSVACEIDCALSFLDGNGSVLHSETVLRRIFPENFSFVKPALTAKREDVYLSKKDQFIHNDTLTIRCRIWNSKDSISESVSCFGETRIDTECRTFKGMIKEFSSKHSTQKYPVCMDSSSPFSMDLFVSADDKLEVEISPTNPKIRISGIFKIFILNTFQIKVKCGQGEFYDQKSVRITLKISKEFLLKYRDYYIPMDQLTIQCEEIVANGGITKEIEYSFNSQDNQKVICKAERIEESSEGYDIEDLPSLKDDLISMFREGILCDTKIRTGNATFPAHITVLSARSPVFKSMFTTDMKEKTNGCVDIDDLDADTVRRMLLFMYSDSLDGLEYESAKNLYYAADKYNIVSLKHRCSSLLKQSVQLSNCCGILFLAEEHQDEDLKRVAHDYIAKNDEAVFISDEWTNFEKDHPQLAIEVFRYVCIRKKK